MVPSTICSKDALECTSKDNRRDLLIYKGETVVYEGQSFEVTRVKPFLVIKSGTRVVCGNLYRQIGHILSKNH
jgi:hypothetical protein